MAEHHDSAVPPTRSVNPLAHLPAVMAILLLGGGILAYLTLTHPASSGDGQQLPARLVRVFEAQKATHQVAITAYGTTRAAEVWTAISEVSGQAVEVNRLFEPGEVLAAGTLLVQIDRTDYELARDRSQADVDARQLAIKELSLNEGHLGEILKLQQRQLELAEAEHERQQQMYAKKASSLSVVEAAENACVAQRTALQQTRQSLALIPVQRLELEAFLRAANVQLQQAQRNLDRCQIRLPLDARCASKSIEVDQFVTVGERLGTFLTLQAAEVVAMVETNKVAVLLQDALEGPQGLDLSTIQRQESLWRRLRIPVEVRWALGEKSVLWLGRLARIGSSLDPGTQTVPLIIEVRHPYHNLRPGVRPPLLPDVFCEVTAYGPVLHDVVVIPRDALHDGRVYLLRRDPPSAGATEHQQGTPAGAAEPDGAGHINGSLHLQPVEVLALEDDLAVIKQGINPGDLVILSDVPQADVSGERLLAAEQMPLRGELLKNPVQPRKTIAVPEGLFDDQQPPETEAPGVGGQEPAGSGQNPAILNAQPSTLNIPG